MDLRSLAEKRSRQPDSSVLLDPSPRRLQKAASAKPAQRQERPAAALTRRERRVKDILLKELARLNKRETGTSHLTYAEKQRLEKSLDVEFIDRELAKMHKQMRQVPVLIGMGVAFAVIMTLVTIGSDLAGGTFVWRDLLYLAPILPALFLAPVQRRSLHRKIFIYEALRELSDADEIDMVLDRASREADALIHQIVDRELALAARLPARPKQHP